ncbi:MAG: hypothetical protein Q6370_020135 [Candidatus Sigynarchaeota archaeon]
MEDRKKAVADIKRVTALLVVALVLGGTGLALGVYSVINAEAGDVGSTKGYIKLVMSARQTVDNDDIVHFDIVQASKGLASENYGICLKAGKTYRIEAVLNIYNGVAGGSLGYMLNNGSGSTGWVGRGAYSMYPGGDTTYGYNSGILEFVTPTTDVTMEVRIFVDLIGTGQIEYLGNTHFAATEL